MKENKGWYIRKYILNRTTGFPFELMEKFRFHHSSKILRELIERERLLNLILGNDELTKKNIEASTNEARLIFNQELHEARILFQEIFSSPELSEAIFFCTFKGFDNLLRRQAVPINRNSKWRRKEQRLMLYLQRFCTKCDTNSFFGPTYIGKMNAHLRKRLLVKIGKGSIIKKRRAYFSHWASIAFCKKIMSDPEMLKHLHLIGNPLSYIRGNQIVKFYFDQRSFKPCFKSQAASPIELAAIKYCNGRAHGQLIDYLSNLFPQYSKRKIEKVLELLLEKNYISFELLFPLGDFTPLASIIKNLRKIESPRREYWLAQAQYLDQLLNKFNSVRTFPERRSVLNEMNLVFPTMTGVPSLREGVDRMLISEECERNIARMELGKTLSADLKERLSIINNVNLIITQLNARAQKDAFVSNFCEQFRRERCIPLLEFIRRNKNWLYRQRYRVHPDVRKLYHKLQENIRVAIDSNPDHVELDTKMIQKFITDHAELLETKSWISPDIFICAPCLDSINQGNFDIVYSESHPLFEYISHLVEIYGQKNVIKREINENYKRFLKEGSEELAVIHYDPRNKYSKQWRSFPKRIILGYSSFSQDKRRDISPSDILVSYDPRRNLFSLRSSSLYTRLEVIDYILPPFYFFKFCTSSMGIDFEFEIRHLLRSVRENLQRFHGLRIFPRIRIEGITVLRKVWLLKKEDVRLSRTPRDDFELFYAITRLRSFFYCPEEHLLKALRLLLINRSLLILKIIFLLKCSIKSYYIGTRCGWKKCIRLQTICGLLMTEEIGMLMKSDSQCLMYENILLLIEDLGNEESMTHKIFFQLRKHT